MVCVYAFTMRKKARPLRYARILYIILTYIIMGVSVSSNIIKSYRAVTISYKHKANQSKQYQTEIIEQSRKKRKRKKRKDPARKKPVIYFARILCAGHVRSASVKPSTIATERSTRRSRGHLLHIISIMCDFFGVSGVFFEVLDSGSAGAPGSTSIGTFELWSARGA